MKKIESKIIVQFFSLAICSSQNQIGRLLANTVVRVLVTREKKKNREKKAKKNLKYPTNIINSRKNLISDEIVFAKIKSRDSRMF